MSERSPIAADALHGIGPHHHAAVKKGRLIRSQRNLDLIVVARGRCRSACRTTCGIYKSRPRAKSHNIRLGLHGLHLQGQSMGSGNVVPIHAREQIALRRLNQKVQ